jgi:hypothetical protein
MGSFNAAAWRITLSIDATRLVVLHEAAHALTANHEHDAEFIAMSRRLYERYLRKATP